MFQPQEKIMPEAAPSPRLSAIGRSLARSRAELPALTALFDAFGPLLEAQARVREAAPGWRGAPPAFDPERFCQGAFLLADEGFQDMSPELPTAARTLLPVMAAAFPALAPDFDALALALASGALPAQKLAAAAFGEALEVPGVGPQALAFAAAEIARPFLARQAEDLLALVKDLPWRQSFCPVCGSAPNMSALRRTSEPSEFIQAHGGKRYLRCSCCAAEWSYKRVSCPACGCEEPDELTIIRAEGLRDFERIDACKRCKSFLPCLDTTELVDAPDLDIAALAMLPLCSRARQEGYAHLAPLPWSEL
jgi:FdhE protein